MVKDGLSPEEGCPHALQADLHARGNEPDTDRMNSAGSGTEVEILKTIELAECSSDILNLALNPRVGVVAKHS